ncbi:MAG: heavy metal-binding domain-containing protein [Sandaracinaceae bacterium]|nr:heavy metal-binding domain-containing protein [Sandaracinaceae bacterium]
MQISGLTGNEIYCLALKGLLPGEIVVGNSVRSMGVLGSLFSFGREVVGGEIARSTSLISEGRHAAIERMEAEAQKAGATGVAGVVSELRTLSGFTEFLAQGTSLYLDRSRITANVPFFSCAASGTELFSHLDCGYAPRKFVMGNVVYSLGIARGFVGNLRTFARGEVVEFSQMYDEVRHLALKRLIEEASRCGANAVVDIHVQTIPLGGGILEVLMTGTASYHPQLPAGQVATSELTGEELWSLAAMGYRPLQLVTATSVYSLGVVAGLSSLIKAIGRGELTELTQIIYEARENCISKLREEATRVGAERVIGNRLTIRELSPGLIEVIGLGTAVVRAPQGLRPESQMLPPQAVLREGEQPAPELHSVGSLPERLSNLESKLRPVEQVQSIVGSLSSCLGIGCMLAFVFGVIALIAFGR